MQSFRKYIEFFSEDKYRTLDYGTVYYVAGTASSDVNNYILSQIASIAERIIATQMDLLRLLNNDGVNGGVNGGVNLEVLIFETIQNSPGINAPAIADQIKKSLRTTQRYLKTLSDANRIEFRGAPKKGGYYIL